MDTNGLSGGTWSASASGTAPWDYEGKKEFEDKLLEFHKNRIYRQHIERALTDDARFRQLKEEAERTNNHALSRQADEIAKNYRDKEIKEIINGVSYEDQKYACNYAPWNHAQVAGLFREPIEAGRGLRGASHTQVKDMLNIYGKELMRKYFNKELDVENGRQLLSVLPGMLYDQVRAEFGGEYPGGKKQFFEDNANYFLNMENALMEVAKSDGLRAMIPERIEAFKRMIRNDQKLQKTLNKNYASQLELIDKYFIEEFLDYLTSVNWKTVTEEQLMAGTKEIIGRFTSAGVRLLGVASAKSPFAGQETGSRESSLARGLAAMTDEGKGLISTRRAYRDPVFMPGPDSDPAMYERSIGVYKTEAARWIARSHLPGDASEKEVQNMMSYLRPVNEIDIQRDEENPAAIFQYNNTGLFYRVRAERNDKGRLTGQIIIESQNTSGKTAEELKDDKWTSRTVNRNWKEDNTAYKEARNDRDLEPTQQRRRVINMITVEFDSTAKENLIRHSLENKWISEDDARRLRNGEVL